MPLPNLTESKDKLKWAYFAGLVDGEGSIRIHRDDRQGLRGGGHNTYYSLKISISNTNNEIMEWLKSNFGGGVYTKKSRNPNHRSCFEWYAIAEDVLTIVMGIYSFLVIKKPQIQVALTYLSCKDSIGGETFYMQMRELNKKGTNYDSKGNG